MYIDFSTFSHLYNGYFIGYNGYFTVSFVHSDFFSSSLIIHRYYMNIDFFFLSINDYLVVITS